MKRTLPLAAVVVLTCLSSRAWADGFMVARVYMVEGRAMQLVASPKQEALMATDGTKVQVILRTHFKSGPKELAWVVPVPAKPDKVEAADDALFTTLQERTAPRFYIMQPSSGWSHLSCGCAQSAGYLAQEHSPSVIVEATGAAGIFDWTVLSATSETELTKWLDANKYPVPFGAERVFAHYVRDKWHFLAMKVRAEESSKPTLAPHPISYTYADTKLVYPMVISQLSADLENEIVLYVLAPSRYACGNWTNGSIDGDELRAGGGSESGTNYEELLRRKTASAGGQAFFTEFHAQSDYGPDSVLGERKSIYKDLKDGLRVNAHLTRLRAIMTPKAMDKDVSLVPVQWTERKSNEYRIMASAAGAGGDPGGSKHVATAVAIPLACLALLCLGMFFKGFGGPVRPAGLAMIALSCAAFAMM